jgi:hypothetical protein
MCFRNGVEFFYNLSSRASGMARQPELFFKLYLIVFLYSGFLDCLLEFSIKTVGSGPTCQSLFDSLRSPYGCSANYAVLQQKKVTKKCRKLNHDGCISQCFLSSSSREFIAKRYRGYFFVLHLHQALRLNLPFSEIVVRLFITL